MFNHKNDKAMKKSYIMPAVIIVNLESENLLAASQMTVGESMRSGSADSRRSSSWEDDEE